MNVNVDHLTAPVDSRGVKSKSFKLNKIGEGLPQKSDNEDEISLSSPVSPLSRKSDLESLGAEERKIWDALKQHFGQEEKKVEENSKEKMKELFRQQRLKLSQIHDLDPK